MNLAFLREVGLCGFVTRKILWRLKMMPKKMTLLTGNKFPLPPDKHFAADVFVTKGNVDWESEHILAEYLSDLNRSEAVDFIDVGAHVGYYTSLISPLVRMVHAFEPDVLNHPFLKDTLKNITNAHAFFKAVSNKCGKGILCQDGNSATSFLQPSESDQKGLNIDTITLDSHVAKHQLRPGAVKIDIEGMDILALQGSLSIAKEYQTVFLVEYNLEDGRPNSWEALDYFCNSARLQIYCVFRKPSGWNDYQYSFGRKNISEVPKLSTKMLFLVPEKAQRWFDNYAATHPYWHRKQMSHTD